MPRWLQFTLALVIGLGLGLLYGWVISPVQYTDTTPDTLREDYRSDYVLMVAESFSSEQNVELAARRIAVLGSEPPAKIAGRALAYAHANGYVEEDQLLIQKLVSALQSWQPVSGASQP